MTAQNATPGRGYIYVEMNIKDPEGFKQYTALSAPAVHAAGGRYIVRGRAAGVPGGNDQCRTHRHCGIRHRSRGARVLPLGGLLSGAPEEAVSC